MLTIMCASKIYHMQVLLCTHLTEIFNDNFLPKVYLFNSLSMILLNCIIASGTLFNGIFFQLMQSENIKFYTMSILKPDNTSSSVDDIVFLYRYVADFHLL